MVTELSKKAIYENARIPASQDEWSERSNSYLERHCKATEQVDRLQTLRRERQNKSLVLDTFIRNIESSPLVIKEFDERLWVVSVEKVKVIPEGMLVLSFKGGTEVEG